MNSDVTTFILPNGLNVVHVSRPNSSNISISTRVLAGSMYENKDEIGVAHFLEHIVLDGTLNYPNKKLLSGLIDEKGGMRNASTNQETIEYVVKVLREDVDTAFEYLSQILIYPQISNQDIEKEKKIIEQEINRFKSDPEKLSSRLIYSLLFPNTRLGILNTGDIDDIKKITRDSLVKYHKKTHCAQNMVVVVCGDIQAVELEKIVKKYFSKLGSGNKLSQISCSEVDPNSQKIENFPNLKQSTLMLGYNSGIAGTLESSALDLISRVLFAGSSSRVRYEIREKRALTYSINSATYSGRNHGIFTVQIGLSESNIRECLDTIRIEFNKVSSELINASELEKAFTFIKSSYLFNFENSLALASFYSNYWCSTGEIILIGEILSKYKKVSQDPVFIQKVAQKVFSKSPAILVLGSNVDGNVFCK